MGVVIGVPISDLITFQAANTWGNLFLSRSLFVLNFEGFKGDPLNWAESRQRCDFFQPGRLDYFHLFFTFSFKLKKKDIILISFPSFKYFSF